MKTSRWVLASLLVACGGSQAEPETPDDAVQVAEEAPATLPISSECPPDPCAGPEATEDDALARATTLARDHLWSDSGGEGAPPGFASPTAEWAQPATELPGSGYDQAGAIVVRAAEVPGGDRGDAAYLALHAEDGWYVCELETMVARGAVLATSFESPPVAQELSQGVPGVTITATFRASRAGGGSEETLTQEHLAICGFTNRPVCFGVVPVADISAAVSEAQAGVTRTRLETAFDGEGGIELRAATGSESELAGSYPISTLRCGLREAGSRDATAD